MEHTSPTLLARVRDPGDQTAWQRFVDLYTPLLVFWGRKAGLGDADVRDLVQEVLALLVRKLPEFKYDGSQTFRGWLRTVTLNKWRELGRKRKAMPVDDGTDMWNELSAEASIAFWERDYDDMLVGRALELMKSRFEEKTWKACLETVVNGRSAADVAKELGISEASVYQARSRVLARLREELAELLE